MFYTYSICILTINLTIHIDSAKNSSTTVLLVCAELVCQLSQCDTNLCSTLQGVWPDTFEYESTWEALK